MITTEQEAARKLCPMLSRDAVVCCSGSACAAWRWLPVTFVGNGQRRFIQCLNPNATEEPISVPPGVTEDFTFVPCEGVATAGWLESQSSADKRRIGFCGLAGRPDGAYGRDFENGGA